MTYYDTSSNIIKTDKINYLKNFHNFIDVSLYKKDNVSKKSNKLIKNCLFEAIKKGDLQSLALFLYFNGSNGDLEYVNARGHTPLTFAVYKDNFTFVKILISEGAKVNPDSNLLESPLMIAIKYCDSNMIQELLKHGAHFNAEEIKVLIKAESSASVDDFNMECASIFSQKFGINPSPLTDLIDEWFDNDYMNNEDIPDAMKKIIEFYCSESNVEYDKIISLLKTNDKTEQYIKKFKEFITNLNSMILHKHFSELFPYMTNDYIWNKDLLKFQTEYSKFQAQLEKEELVKTSVEQYLLTHFSDLDLEQRDEKELSESNLNAEEIIVKYLGDFFCHNTTY